MKIVIFLLLLITYTFSATIDKAFFEGDNVLKYYESIEKELNSTIRQKLKDPKIIELERSTLQKLKKLQTLKPETKSFPFSDLSKMETINANVYLNTLYTLAKLSVEIKHLQTKEKEFQEKLFELKNTIEKEVETNGGQSTLLSDQMQYAFYKISKEKLSKTLSLYQALYEKEFGKFQKALSRVHFARKTQAKKIIDKTNRQIQSLEKKDILLTIDKDSEVLHPENPPKKIEETKKRLQEETQAVLSKKMRTYILLALQYLQQNNQKEYLHTMELLDEDIQKLSGEEKEILQSAVELILQLGEQHSDTTSVAIASTQIGLQNIIQNLDHYLNKTLFVYEEKAFSIKTILIFAFILAIGFIVAKIYKNFVDKFRKTNRIKSLSTARMVANSGYYIIILATFFIALKTIGLDMHTIFIVIGAILLWLAFGLQSFISNYAIGTLLRIDRSIRIGDHIELDPNTVGDVDDMDFRSITIRSSDNTRTTIPNSRFISGTFINHTLEGVSRRLHVHFSAGKYIPHEEIEQKILSALHESDLPHLDTEDKKAQVAILDINRKIVRYALLVWVPKELTYDMTLAQSMYLKLIHSALYPAKPNKTSTDTNQP